MTTAKDVIKTEYHKIDISLYDNVTVKTIKEILSCGLSCGGDLDLNDELFFTVEFKNLDEFLTFWGKYGKYIRTVWDNTTEGQKFHNYV